MKRILWFDESPAQHLFQLSGKRFQIDDRPWNTDVLMTSATRLSTLASLVFMTRCTSRTAIGFTFIHDRIRKGHDTEARLASAFHLSDDSRH